MIAALKRIYRYAFCSPAKRTLLELFDQAGNLRRAIVLTETAPLSGTTVTYTWQEFPKSCRVSISLFKHAQNVHVRVQDRELPQPEVGELIRQINLMGGVKLGNFSGKARDGIFYRICWGTPSELVNLSIRNPQIGSKQHQTLVRLLKEHAQSNIACQPQEGRCE